MTGFKSKRAAAQAIDEVNWADHEPDGRGAAAQEPVAWHYDNFGTLELSRIQRVGWKPLYATPPQRPWVGLTDEEIYSLADSLEIWNEDDEEWILDPNTFARAIEAAHGIGENPDAP